MREQMIVEETCLYIEKHKVNVEVLLEKTGDVLIH